MSDFWKGRTVLVTGAGGFIGSHLTERLLALGANVRALCHYNSNGDAGWLRDARGAAGGKLDIRFGDIRDSRFIEEMCADIDTVFHLAALIAIPYSYRAPESFIDTNVKGTLNVLEAVRRQRCRLMVNTSTSEVYGTPATVPIDETFPLQGQSPYSASKIGADKIAEAYACSFKTPVVTLRPFNTYGPRQSTRAIIPTILTQLIAGKKVVQLGSLEPRRDLTFVADTVEGFVRVSETEGVEGAVFQLGTGRSVSIAELFEVACRTLDVQARAVTDEARVRPDASEVMVLMADPGKANRSLGWSATVPLEEGLSRTARWLTEHADRFDADKYHI